MSHDSRPPWLRPIEYVEDRFDDKHPAPTGATTPGAGDYDPSDHEDERSARDISEILNRGERPERVYECTDTTPLNYDKGPHHGVFDCAPDDQAGNGPHRRTPFFPDDEDEAQLADAGPDNYDNE